MFSRPLHAISTVCPRTQMRAFKEYNPFFNEQNKDIISADEYPYVDYDEVEEISFDDEALRVAAELTGLLSEKTYNDERVWKRVRQVVVKSGKTEYMFIARLMGMLGCKLAEAELYAVAEILVRRALCLGSKLLGDDHPDLAPATEWLSKIVFRQQKFEEAVLLIYTTTKLIHLSAGPRHPDTASCFFSLAAIVDAMGLSNHAVNLRSKAHELMCKYAPMCGTLDECYNELMHQSIQPSAPEGMPFYPVIPYMPLPPPPYYHPHNPYDLYHPHPFFYPMYPPCYLPYTLPPLPPQPVFPHPFMMDMRPY